MIVFSLNLLIMDSKQKLKKKDWFFGEKNLFSFGFKLTTLKYIENR